jgi:hypothetical protein
MDSPVPPKKNAMPPDAAPNNNPTNDTILPVPPPNNNSQGLKLSKRLFLILTLTLLALYLIDICLQVYSVRELVAENEILKNLNEAKTMELLWWKAVRVGRFDSCCHCLLDFER